MTDQVKYQKPLPTITDANRPYWDACRNHELKLQRCSACAHLWFPPSFICPNCLGSDIAWEKVSGRGKIWSHMRMWQRYFPGFSEDLPYIVAYIELEEGPRMMSTIVGREFYELHCDMDVEVVFDDVTREISLPKFRTVTP